MDKNLEGEICVVLTIINWINGYISTASCNSVVLVFEAKMTGGHQWIETEPTPGYSCKVFTLRVLIEYLSAFLLCRIPINYLLLNMAVADILYSTFLVPELISTHSPSHPQGLVGRILCSLLTKGNLAWLGAGSSIFSLVAIAAERYYAVTYPLENKGKLTSCKLKVCIRAVNNNNPNQLF